jgi:environmental stress-induced protein Ves
MPVERFVVADLPASPWKNGGGLTRPIVARPPTSGTEPFDWRVSVAEIEADGSFSIFGGVDRVIVLLQGDGVQLRSADGRVDHRLDEPLAPFAFSGDMALTASMLGAASSDFNVMTRRAAMRAEVRVVRSHDSLFEAAGGVVLAVRGTWIASTVGHSAYTERQTLAPGMGLWWDDQTLAWELEPNDAGAECALIAVRVWRR